MAFAAPAIPYIMAAMTVAQGVQSYQQGKAQQKYYNQLADQEGQARTLERNAQRKKDEIYQAQQLAAIGKSGVKLAGSPMRILENTVREQERGIIIGDYNSNVQQSSLRNQGKQAAASGRSSLLGSFVGAAGSLYAGGVFDSGADPSVWIDPDTGKAIKIGASA